MESSGIIVYYEGCLTFPNNICVIFYDVHKHICVKTTVLMQGCLDSNAGFSKIMEITDFR